MRAALVFACLAALAGAAWADPAVDAGQGLFTGQSGPGQLRAFPCHRCHGRDGRGNIEGKVPDIAARAASYDVDRLRKAVTEGQAPDGRALSRLMPRYAISETQAETLLAYLLDLPLRERRGVAPSVVRLAIMAEGDADYPARLRAAFLALVPQGRLHGRTVEFVQFDSLEAAQAEALALVGAPSGLGMARAESLGLPILFPRQWLTGAEDASLVRGLSATRRDVAAAMAADLRALGLSGFTPTPGLNGGLLEDLQLELDADPDPRVRILSAPEPPAALPRSPPAIVYVLPQAMAQATAWQAAGWQVRLVLDAPGLVDAMLAEGLGPSEAHARLTAHLLAQALRHAGRDLTRRGLLDALTRADLADLSLDYAAIPLTGTAEVAILPLD